MAIAAAGLCLVQAIPIYAQIASYVDERGKVTFINTDSPSLRRSPMSANSTRSRSTAYDPYTTVATVPPDPLDRIVHEAAERHNLDPVLVKAVIETESGWNPKAVSRKGALGLMQLVPTTAGKYGVYNAFDPAQNVNGGARYLRTLLDRYHGDLEKTLAAYNAGEGAVERFGGVPNYPETRAYVQKVRNYYFRPGSGRDPKLWNPPKPPVRRVVDELGRVVFTNE